MDVFSAREVNAIAATQVIKTAARMETLFITVPPERSAVFICAGKATDNSQVKNLRNNHLDRVPVYTSRVRTRNCSRTVPAHNDRAGPCRRRDRWSAASRGTS